MLRVYQPEHPSKQGLWVVSGHMAGFSTKPPGATKVDNSWMFTGDFLFDPFPFTWAKKVGAQDPVYWIM